MKACRLMAGVVVATVLAAGWARPASADEVSPIILPKPDIPLAFSHQQHLKLNLKCTMCHDSVLNSRKPSDVLFPKEPVCLSCHNVKAPNPAKAFPKATCDTCHPGFKKGEGEPAPVRAPEPNLNFPHRTHTVIGILCTDCHKGLEKATKPSWDHIPNMETCLTCHDGNAAPAQCRTCHLTKGNAQMQTTFTEGILAPTGRFRDDDHRDPAWLYKHRVAALGETTYCQQCHTQAECLDCHAGANKPSFHENNYALLHSRDAYTDGGQCMSCHVASRDCETCHAQTNLTLESRVGGAGKVHPDGWNDFAGGPNHHGAMARRSAASCASCHPEQDCIDCHSSRTLRINPHPPGFNPDRFAVRTEAACKKCHDTIPR